MKPAKFKMTELGPIPEDWEVRYFDDVYSFAAAGDLQKECYSPIQDAAHKYSIFSNGLLKKGLYGYTSQPRYKHDSITITGRGTLGHAEYRDEDFDAIIRLLILTPKEHICNRFVVYWINYFKPFTNESTSIPQLTVPQVASSCLALPPLAEQRRIAGALSDVDELISALGKLVEKKRAIKTGAMQQLLTGKRRLPGFKGKWVEKRLREIGISVRGVSFSPEQSSLAPLPNTTMLLRANNIQDNRFVLEDIMYVQDECIADCQRLKEGDILICAANGSRNLVGKAAMWKQPSTATFGAFMAVFRCVESVDSAFIGYFFQSASYKKQLDDILTGSAINNLNTRDIEGLCFSLPPLPEQRAIAAVLSDMDAEIAALEAERAKYARIKSGMMQQLLTGKTRLR